MPDRVTARLTRPLLLLLLFAAAGLAGGYAWRHLWTPPTGVAREGQWIPTPVEEGLQGDFSAVGWYVVVALTLGLVLGALTAFVLDRAEILGVLVAVVGSALAAYLILTVGERLSPPDPDEVAAESADGTEIPGDLELDGRTPLLSAPIGALTALSTVYLLTTRRRLDRPVERGNPRVGSGRPSSDRDSDSTGRNSHSDRSPPVSSSLPPDGPPPGAVPPPPPPPPTGPTEYLDSGSGRPFEPGSEGGGGGLRKGLLVAGGVVGLVAIGVGAWAAVSFLATGPQPAEALPDTTLAYLSVDLDPSGGQKIEALRTLNKFPAFEDEVGIDTDDDIRKAIFDRIHGEIDCDGLDYEDDIEPWLGERAAVAAVDTGADTPDPVFVLQVKDADAAEKGLEAIKDCAGADEGGWAIDGDWAVIAETDEIAESVSDDAAQASLADDDDFQKWVGEAGDSGVVTIYAGPALGDYLADNADELFGFPFGGSHRLHGLGDAGPGDRRGPDRRGLLRGRLRQRGRHRRPEREVAGQRRARDRSSGTSRAWRACCASTTAPSSSSSPATATSPAATCWRATRVATPSRACPRTPRPRSAWASARAGSATCSRSPGPTSVPGRTSTRMLEEIEAETGLVLPDDIETLFGDSAALALGSDFDPEAIFESSDGSDIPIALKVDGRRGGDRGRAGEAARPVPAGRHAGLRHRLRGRHRRHRSQRGLPQGAARRRRAG